MTVADNDKNTPSHVLASPLSLTCLLLTSLWVSVSILWVSVSIGQGYPPTIAGALVEQFKTVDDVALNLWVFLPEGHRASDSRPAMVFFFGGGWNGGSPAHFERQARVLQSLGVVAILADYRVLSRHGTRPAIAVEDAKSAVRWVRQHASDMGIDPNRIGAGGGSSGGHLAASTATLPTFDHPDEDHAVSSRPNALVLFNPVVIVAPVEGRFELNEALQERMAAPLHDLSPYHHIGSDLPPTLIVHGTEDDLVPVATVAAYCERVVAFGSKCELISYEGAGHGFFNNDPYYERTLGEMLRHLESLGWVEL